MVNVSVIVPVYNAAPYLTSCINSLLRQTLQDCEFIFVNDGSTDGSRAILEEFQQKDSRIILLHQENRGVSAARNAGIALATGTYVGFVDADDVVEPQYYETLYSQALRFNVDVVVSHFVSSLNGALEYSKPIFETDTLFEKEFIQNTIIPFCIQQDGFNSTCNKLYKRNCISNYKINFPEGFTHGEDALFNLKLLTQIDTIIFIDYAGYYYRTVEDSATRNCIEKDFFQNALGVFQFDHKTYIDLVIPLQELEILKSVRFVDTVISLIHISFAEPNISFRRKYHYVKKMINNPILQHVLSQHFNLLLKDKNRYGRFILNQIKSKSMLKLVLAVNYSNYRNRNKHENIDVLPWGK